MINFPRKIESCNKEVFEELKNVNKNFVRRESDLAITKNASNLLSSRVFAMERQCWANS